MPNNEEDVGGNAEEHEEENDHHDDTGDSSFYWKQGRENLLTESGLRMFQLAYAHKDEPYETAREKIDTEYDKLSPRLQRKGRSGQRHGGFLSNYIVLFEELGLMYRDRTQQGTAILRATPAGEQAALLLQKVPDYLKVVPHFLLQVLVKYRLNNPLNKSERNPTLAKSISSSDVFPYWSLFRIMRACEDYLTKEELALFVFKLSKMDDIPEVIKNIHAYRKDIAQNLSIAEIYKKYGEPLVGSIAQPKYIMGRAGVQRDLIVQDKDKYSLNPSYRPFVDQLLKTQPQFEELSEDAWIKTYGEEVDVVDNNDGHNADENIDDELLTSDLLDNDPVFNQIHRLLKEDGFAGIILIGPPGTGKSWYARQAAIKLIGGVKSHLREVQFHASYQYEDFVEGYIPDNKGGFKLADRHLLEMCRQASRDDGTYVLLIDELSRTDPSRVMGEAMTYMESSLRGETFYLPSGRRASIPPNLIFIATMNPEDRSVDEIDAAMDRRWGKIYLTPDIVVLRSFLNANGIPGGLLGAVAEFFIWVQQHYKLGHAFFRTVRDIASLKRLWDHQLLYLFEKAFRYDPDTLTDIKNRWAVAISSADQIE